MVSAPSCWFQQVVLGNIGVILSLAVRFYFTCLYLKFSKHSFSNRCIFELRHFRIFRLRNVRFLNNLFEKSRIRYPCTVILPLLKVTRKKLRNGCSDNSSRVSIHAVHNNTSGVVKTEHVYRTRAPQSLQILLYTICIPQCRVVLEVGFSLPCGQAFQQVCVWKFPYMHCHS